MAAGKADGSIIINTKILESGFNKGLAAMKGKLSGFGRSVGDTMDQTGQRVADSMGKAAEKVERIGKALVAAFSLAKLIQFGKEAIQLGSDLAEMENVTSTVFPHMTKEINEWSDAALDNYGLTRTMAKNYVGTFGAMSKAFGFSEKKAFEMSTALAGLSGDVASFYNLSQDEAFSKLKSIYTGETEALKSLGVVMTQSALDQYALANGWGRTVSQMTEAEKVELRMAFVTDKLNAASGDFVKTQDSWANQTKRLSANFQELKTTIGQGLINLFTPVIKGINTLLSYLHTAAKAFNTFTATLMGKRTSSSGGGGAVGASSAASEALSNVADTASGVANNTSDAADATNDYAAAQKAAQKAASGYLSTLDEVNRYTTQQAADTGSSSSPKSGSGSSSPASSGASGVPAQLEQIYDDSAFAVEEIEGEFSEFAQKLRDAFLAGDWEGLGQIIGEKINEILGIIKEKISWENVGPAITKFVDAFTRTFNSLVKTIDWHLLGETIATGINTIIYTLNLLITGIDWGLLGRSFASGVNGLAETVDWEALGDLLGERFLISWRLFAGFVSEVNWGGIGGRIGNGLMAALKKLNKNADLIYGAMSNFGTGLAEFLNELITPELFEEVGTTIATSLNTQLTFLNSFGETFEFEEFGSSLASGIKKIFHDFDWQMLGRTVTVWAKRLLASAKFFLSERPWETLFDGVKVLIENIDFKEIGTEAIEAIWTGLSGEDMDEGTKENVLSSFSELESSLSTIANFVFTNIENFYTNFLKPVAGWSLGEGLPELARIIANTFKNVDWEGLQTNLDDLYSIIGQFTEGIGEGLLTFLNALANIVSVGLSITIGLLEGALNFLKGTIAGYDSDVVEAVGKALGVLLGAFVTYKITKTIYDGIAGLGGALPGLLTAVTAHPALTIAACGVAIGTAVYEIWKNSKSQNQKDIENTATAIGKLNDELSSAPKEADADAEYANTLLDKYLELNEKLITTGELDEGDQTLFEYYHDQLISYCGEMETYIGKVGTAYTGTRKELEKLISKQKEQALSSAYWEIYGSYAKEAATQTIQMNDAINELRDAYIAAGGDLQYFTEENIQEYIRLAQSGESVTLDTSTSFGAFAIAVQRGGDAVDGAIGSIVTAQDSIDAAHGKMDEIETQIYELNTAVGAGNVAFESYADGAESASDRTGAAAGGVRKSVGDMAEETSQILDTHKGDGDAYGTEIAEGAARGINGREESVKAAIRNVAGSVTKTYGDEMGLANGSSSVMEGAGNDTVKGIETGTSDRKSQLLSIFEELPSNMMDMMGDLMTEFRFPGRIIISGIRYGINDNKQALFDHLAGLVPTMAAQFSGLNATMWTIGHNAMQYLANGLRSVHIPRPVFGVGTSWANAAGVAFPIPNVNVTWMASGGVIPKNSAKFLAGLGDNNHETEVVSPISTMKQAFTEALMDAGIAGGGSRTTTVKVQINRRTVYEEMMSEARERMDRTGINPFDLGTT